MSRTTKDAEKSPPTCVYDSLLEEFLPIIHKAACSVCDHQTGFSGDLLLAGLQGLKEAFMHTGETNYDVCSETARHRIYTSIRQQIQINALN